MWKKRQIFNHFPTNVYAKFPSSVKLLLSYKMRHTIIYRKQAQWPTICTITCFPCISILLKIRHTSNPLHGRHKAPTSICHNFIPLYSIDSNDSCLLFRIAPYQSDHVSLGLPRYSLPSTYVLFISFCNVSSAIRFTILSVNFVIVFLIS